MKEQLKASVLAKCEELQRSMDGFANLVIDNGYFYPSADGYKLKGRYFSIDVDKDIPADDYVWPLAADLLGIKPKEERPSDALLSRVWESGFIIGSCNSPFSDEGKAAALDALIATLPATNLVELPEYDKAFEDRLFAWARENNNLGWNEDGHHTHQSIFEHGLINGAKHMYRIIYGKEHPNV